MEQEIGVTHGGALYNRKYDSYRVSYSVSKHINENARFVLFLLGVVKSFLGSSQTDGGAFQRQRGIRGENFNTVDSTRNYRVIHKRIV